MLSMVKVTLNVASGLFDPQREVSSLLKRRYF
jgi:hypothetical protein